jgi:hypothetical protein
VRLPDDFTGLTDPGWPRPRYKLRYPPEGFHPTKPFVHVALPVPWITEVPNFAGTDPGRRLDAQAAKLCQVCGHVHLPGSEVIVFLNGKLRAVPWAKEIDLQEYRNVILRAIDDAIMHERCARLAAGNCPKLKSMRAEGNLFVFAGPIEAVDEYEDPEKPLEANQAGIEACRALGISTRFQTYLAMEGRRARVFEL